jgi:hypothetical protein
MDAKSSVIEKRAAIVTASKKRQALQHCNAPLKS